MQFIDIDLNSKCDAALRGTATELLPTHFSSTVGAAGGARRKESCYRVLAVAGSDCPHADWTESKCQPRQELPSKSDLTDTPVHCIDSFAAYMEQAQ